MLPLDDPDWQSFKGGYRVEYDARPALSRLFEVGSSGGIWDEFWNELHHQGDVDQASYAIVPWIVEWLRISRKIDWNALALIAVIELERTNHNNPTIDSRLSEAYFEAIRSLPAILGNHSDQEWTELLIGPATACIALARGQRWFAKACIELDRDTAGKWFTEEFGWEFGD